MKALIKDEPTKSYKYVDIPIPEPAEDELLVKVEKVAICGSDINLYQWNAVAQVIATLPFTPGHELAGIVTKVGSKVTDIKVGQRVCVENHYYCGKCYQCTHEQNHICQNMGQPGHGKKTIHGGCSEYTIIPARYAYVLKTDIDPLRACLLEPLGVAHHALEEIDVKGQDLLIIGCGPIGLFAIAVAKELGVTKIIAADIFDDKLAAAKKMGADVVINSKNEDLLKKD
jgi:threonine dehydrogenase-like Zn-dependent dehydrogenase